MKKKHLSRIGTVIILTVAMLATYLPIVSLPVFAYNESCQLDFGEEPIRVYEAGYTDFSGSVTNLNLGTYNYVRFEVGAGSFTKTDGNESIPFLVDDEEHSTLGQTVKTNRISSTDETINFSIYIDPNDWGNATPGVYRTTLSGKGNFIGGNSTYLYGGFSLELTLTIPDYSTHYAVEVLQSDNGTICTNTETAADEETVTVTAAPDDGYKLESVSVICEGVAIETRRIDRTTVQFTMPTGDVTVTPEFVEKTIEDDFDYKVKDGEAIITGYLGDGGDVIIPGVIGGYPVITLGERVFFRNDQITSVTFPEGLTSIENHAFYECHNLTSVDLPQGLVNIGTAVFSGCSKLEDCELPDTVITMGSSFDGTSLKTVEIPGGVTVIDDGTFSECQLLESVLLPEGLKRIGKHAFNACPALKSIVLPSEIEVIDWYAFCDSGITDVYYKGTKTKWNGHVEKKEHWDCNSDNSGVGFTIHYYSELTLDPNGADAAAEEAMVWSNEATIPQCGFTMEGKEFAEWNTKQDGTGQSYQPGDLLPFEENTTLYAQWEDPKPPAFDLNDEYLAIGNQVWFGGFNEPLSSSWMVLGSWNEGTVLLLSDKVLDNIQYNSTANGVRDWRGSTAQKWCTNLFNSAEFNDIERMAIVPTTKEASSDSNYTLNHALEEERFFFLSSEELTALFNSDKDRAATGATNIYWTRSIHSGVSTIYYVAPGGSIAGMGSTTSYCGARPAFNLDLSKVLFASSAENGKQTDEIGVNSLSPVGKNNTGEWKLTLRDPSRDGFSASVADADALTKEDGYSDWSITVNWNNAMAGDDEYVSAILMKNSGDELLYYGCVAQNQASTENQQIAIPEGLEVGDYTLLLFNEQRNGDKLTDYASDFVSFPLKVVHDLTRVPAKPATCTEAGNTEYYTCSCGKYFSDAEGTTEIDEGSWIVPIDPDAHDEEVVVTPATMTRNGSLVSRCINCGEELKHETIYIPSEFNIEKESFTYTGEPIEPTVTIVDSNGSIIDPQYFDLTYANNVDAGAANILITWKDHYSGTIEKSFNIEKASLKNAKITLKTTSYTYTGTAKKPVVSKVVDENGELVESSNYSVSYENNINAGIATVVVSGKNNYKDSTKGTFKINQKKITPKVTKSYSTTTWNGKNRAPTVTVYDGNTKLTKNKDYSISMASSRKNVGKYTITIKQVSGGNYSFADVKTSFKINPKGTTLKALTAQSKAFKVTWNKQTTKMSSSVITGYQIQWSTSSTFAKDNHTKKVSGSSSSTKTINSKVWSGIKGGKKYYVRIRTYKTTSSGTYYSSWSAKQSVTTKK